MYISFKNTTIEILFFSRKSNFYFWTATTSATSALEKFHTRQVLVRFVKKDSWTRVDGRSDMYMGDKSFRNIIQFLLALL